jgi:hypothetical protein
MHFSIKFAASIRLLFFPRRSDESNTWQVKWLLGVNRYTSNCGSRAEFGIYPLCLYILQHSSDYLEHVKNSENKALPIKQIKN